MKGFKERAHAFETKFAREQEAEFIINLRACSIFAKWVATEKLGLSKSATKRYCDKIISLSVRNCNPNSLFEHVQMRLQKNKIDITNQELDLQFVKALGQARAELS